MIASSLGNVQKSSDHVQMNVQIDVPKGYLKRDKPVYDDSKAEDAKSSARLPEARSFAPVCAVALFQNNQCLPPPHRRRPWRCRFPSAQSLPPSTHVSDDAAHAADERRRVRNVRETIKVPTWHELPGLRRKTLHRKLAHKRRGGSSKARDAGSPDDEAAFTYHRSAWCCNHAAGSSTTAAM
jgi:hypothetical protein